MQYFVHPDKTKEAFEKWQNLRMDWYKSLGILFQDFVRYEYPAKDNIFFGKVWDKENLNIENALKLSYQQLSQIYGKYFTGSKNQVLMKLAKYVSLKGL